MRYFFKKKQESISCSSGVDIGKWVARTAVVLPYAIPAFAQSSGVSGMFTNLGSAAKNFISLIAIIAVAIGIAAVLYGLVMMAKKGMGRGDDVEWRQITWPLIGGALSSVLMYVVYALVTEVGANNSNMGKAGRTEARKRRKPRPQSRGPIEAR